MNQRHDLFIIGGGVNGAAIARDGAGRGLSVALAEKGDLASATSSASTKLFHGGLRYLEYFEFGLVRAALGEREILLRNMPHIAWPMRFVLPLHPEMRFEATSTASKLINFALPWTRGKRPAWMIRFGLFLYDRIAARDILPPTKTLSLVASSEGAVLQGNLVRAYEYSDVWAQDSRLVALLARDASERGAMISTRNAVLSLKRHRDYWEIETERGPFEAKAIVNAAGPWVDQIRQMAGVEVIPPMRLVRGSHIVTKKLYPHDKAYFFQGDDGRIIFALPYERDFTLIGTTEAEHDAPDDPAICSEEEARYLCERASAYLRAQVSVEDIIWSYSGVRPLVGGEEGSASAASREYILALDEDAAPILNVLGGKITTHRVLADQALGKLADVTGAGKSWTRNAPLAGGDFDPGERGAQIERFCREFLFFAPAEAERIFSSYGMEAWEIFAGASADEPPGENFGHGLYAREVDHLIDHEFARSTEDVLWRRTKLGLVLEGEGRAELTRYMKSRLGAEFAGE